jgi:hypothetical protein
MYTYICIDRCIMEYNLVIRTLKVEGLYIRIGVYMYLSTH